MANQLPKFLSGAQLVIKLRNVLGQNGNTQDMVLAYATNLSFQQNMATTGVQVIGAFANQSIEPLGYTASGALSVVNYVDTGKNTNLHPAESAQQVKTKSSLITEAQINAPGSSNSMLHRTQFMPRQMLFAKTFDIDVTLKDGVPLDIASFVGSLKINQPNLTDAQIAAAVQVAAASKTGSPIYTIYDCRFSDWNIAFAPGQLASERVSFICRGIRFNLLGAAAQAVEDKKGDFDNFGNATAPN